MNIKPNPASWSVAQVLDHVIRTNASYFPVIEALHAGRYKAHWLSKVPGMPGFFGKALLKAMNDGRAKRHKTFPVWEPSVSAIPDDVLDRFLAHQQELGKVMQAAQPLLEAKVVISSPAKRFVVYSLADAFEIILAHEERHLLQVQEILDLVIQKSQTNRSLS